ncbi:MAG: tetraacyldisaccharide 4'-kinase [Alphaproteobacteria bacterium]|nr:tetraacyldisaccharide 4'-kinase [Alphaproteobacteria bacterium]
MRPPEFWHKRDAVSRAAALWLSPLGRLYGASVAWKARHADPVLAGVPVICIGNLTVGGTGKTPVAIAVAKILKAKGRSPAFLSRGYGGRMVGPHMVCKADRAADVGDEPLLLLQEAPVVVASYRPSGARVAVKYGADIIVMDDGHQNFSLAKDFSIVVVDTDRMFGNGRTIPAGPLREPVAQGLSRAQAVVAMGDGAVEWGGYPGPVLKAQLVVDATDTRGKSVVAFAGIGNPAKFFRALRENGSNVVAAIPFADHHFYSNEEIGRLKDEAGAQAATLVTTEKDLVRLTPEQRAGITVLPVRAVFEKPAELQRLLDTLFTSG